MIWQGRTSTHAEASPISAFQRSPDRVAVTGGAGFIGSHVVERLVGEGASVLVIDDFSRPCGSPPPDEVDLVVADCGGGEAMAALRAFRPRVVVHLAARGGVAVARRDPVGHAATVLNSSIGAFAAACEAGAEAIVSASSGGAVYGDAGRLPCRESDPVAPRSAYGAGKLAEEAYLGALGRENGVRTLPLRFANVYGPRQDGTGEAGVVAITCRLLLAGRAPRIAGDGEQSRDFVEVADVSDAVLRGVHGDAAGPHNVGTGVSTSVLEVVAALSRWAGVDVVAEHLPARAGEVRHARIDPAAAARDLGWEPRVTLEAGLRRTFDWFADHAVSRRPYVLPREESA